MTDRGDHELRDDADIERALRGLPPAKADEEFRTRLRDAFVSGRIDGDRVVGPGDSAKAIRRGRRLVLWSLAAVAVLLVTVLGVLVLRGDRPEFRVFEVSGTGNVTVDGRAIPVTDREQLQESLEPGAELSVPASATLALVIPGTAIFELVGGTRMTLPWASGDAPGRVEAGELRFASGPEFAGRALNLSTPDGFVAVTGTLISVQCDDQGTCVCVLEGNVRVGRNDGDMEPIPPGRRKVMMRSGETEISPSSRCTSRV